MLLKLVMLIKTDAFDVVPIGRLVAFVTFTDNNTFAAPLGLPVSPGHYRFINHFEVHHVVTWRGLMALNTLGRARGRVDASELA